MRLIDADTLIISLGRVLFGDNYADACQAVDAMPTIEPKKGKWIHERLKSENSTIGYFDAPECCCSECGGYVEHETGFCPHCGADMRQEGEDNG